MGLETLSGIPGTVGAAPVQNVGAYGHEISEVVSSVTTLDRETGQRRQFSLSELGFGYRTSVLKESLEKWGPSPRWIVLDVEFAFRHATLSAPVAYAQLARTLGCKVGDRVDALAVREAVLDLRRGKGMVLDAADPDTHSAGSFFTNPIVSAADADTLPPDAPRYPVLDHSARRNIADAAPEVPGLVKTSAAWLIDHAGFTKGFALTADAPVALSTKHALAITRRSPDATAADISRLRQRIVEGVRDTYGVTLRPEPVTL